MPVDAYHQLLTTRYVCEICLTRYFVKYRNCMACKTPGRIRPLTNELLALADNDVQLRAMMAAGTQFRPFLHHEDNIGTAN